MPSRRNAPGGPVPVDAIRHEDKRVNIPTADSEELLDPEVAHRVRSGLERLCDEDGLTLLVTSHDMLEVERLCERVVFVNQGRIVADGHPHEITSHYGRGSLEEVFSQLVLRADPERTAADIADVVADHA